MGWKEDFGSHTYDYTWKVGLSSEITSKVAEEDYADNSSGERKATIFKPP